MPSTACGLTAPARSWYRYKQKCIPCMHTHVHICAHAHASTQGTHTILMHTHTHTLRCVRAITHIHVHTTQAILARDNCIRLLDTERWTILQRFSGFRCTQQHIRCDLSPDGRVPAHGIWPAFSFSLSGSFLPPPTTKKMHTYLLYM